VIAYICMRYKMSCWERRWPISRCL